MRSISSKEWTLRREAFEGRLEEVRLNQQRLFRVFQALARQDTITADKFVADGAPLDVPLILDDKNPESIPNANNWRPVGGERLHSVTLLGWAAANGDFDTVKWLLRRGAEPAQTFSGNLDAAWLAMEQGNDDIHKFLMDRGCAPSLRVKDEFNSTRLMAAVMGTFIAPIRHILAKKVNVNAVDARGRTALHLNLAKDPYSEDDADVARMLLDANANPNIEDLDGIPPHALNQSPVVVGLLQGQELRQVSEHALAALEQQKKPVEPTPDDLEIDPKVIVPQMPRQGPRRL